MILLPDLTDSMIRFMLRLQHSLSPVPRPKKYHNPGNYNFSVLGKSLLTSMRGSSGAIFHEKNPFPSMYFVYPSNIQVGRTRVLQIKMTSNAMYGWWRANQLAHQSHILLYQLPPSLLLR
ncbi:hypothetical protein O6P43_026074 [Quillaja saponaria]|uniref:Uncharacterized protein n=1 Tax=Quillaja saponaria TaxID=32244 RepID=A0AAD7LAC5_QUISA|nr:hypothetical protein O6P43_026074 [Quillaja saponaria]